MKKITNLLTTKNSTRLGLLPIFLLLTTLMHTLSGNAQTLFSQDFSSSSTLSNYVSGSPNSGQFNAITTSGTSSATITSNALKFTRGSGATSFTRSTSFSPTPTAIIYEFDLTVSGTPNGNVATPATWQIGSGYSTGTNGVETNANTYAQMAIDFRGTSSFRFNDISNATTSGNYSVGTTVSITWVMNNSGSTISYVAPDGTIETLANDRVDFWTDTTRLYNDVVVETAAGSIQDMKFAYTGSTGSITMDNMKIQALVTPQDSVFSGNTICSGAIGQLTITSSAGTGPFTVIYNDGTANRTATSVTSGTPFNVFTDPTVTTNYTLVSLAEASGAIRTSGFTDSSATITVNAPIANAGTALATICKGSTSAALGGSVSGTATGGTWSDGGVGGTFNPNATTLNATWTPPAAYTGTATLTLTTSGGSCGTTTASKTQVVNGIPTATAGGSQTICVNATATVSGATSSNGTISWTDNGLGSITSGATTLTPVYTPAAGDAGNTVTLTMTVTNSPCTPATATYTVIVKALPTATAGGSQTICSNGTATVSGATSSNGTILWTDNGLGSITSGATTLTPVYTPAAGDAGNTVTLTMTVTNSPCNSATATYTVIVKGIPTATAGGSQTICAGGTAAVSGATSSNGTISWTENGLGSITSGATTLTPVYTSAAGDAGTTVTLTMTVTNSPCTSATATYSVIVSPLAPAAAGTITGSTSVCAGVTLLNYSIAAVTNATNYTWTVPSGWSITAGQGTNSITATAGGAGTGNITVVASNFCGSTNPSQTSVLNITPVIATNTTGYTTSSAKTDGNITCASSVTAPERRGYLKFPLSGLPSGAIITASTLNLTNNASGALSGVTNNVNALGNDDPTTTAAATLFASIGSGTAYNAATWNNTGTIALTLNATANADMQSRLASPGYIAMGLFRGAGSSIYNFFGYGGGASAPTLAVTYTAPRSIAVTVNPIVTPTFTAVAPICSGRTLSALPTTSTNGITGTWSPALNNTATTTYTFTPTAGLCATTTTLQIVVNPNVTPTFTAVSAICSGGTLTALPTTSTNGITGTWSPALNNTATTTYTFTPTAGLCATTTTLQIVVNPNVTPTFTAVAPKCSGSTLSALPTTSNNGITGTWSPALNNTATTTYTFTPTAGLCATTTTLQIVVNPNVTPTFTAVAPICSGVTLSALPTTSNNGITGTWSPALNNTATTTYTFTPTAGLCATTTTLQIVVNPNITPTFTAVAPICSGVTLSALPTTSNNGITGTWSPALDNAATTTYTFTPDSGQCAFGATLEIIVNPNITPTFTAVSPICSRVTLSALPTTSNNGITGTWSPALDNTATTTYTFTPTAGLCATTTTLQIVVNPNITPTFTAVAPICSGGTLWALPTTSNNGITGTWSPALDNTATTTYTFTPDSGQCAFGTTLEIIVNPILTPTFTAVSPICSGGTLSALPTTSTNGVSGTWSPALDNTATTTYTFSPNNGECATTTTLEIIVNPILTPTFDPVASICSGTVLSALPTTSNNGVSGTWSPALNNSVTTTYTFTPNNGECAIATTLTIIVNHSTTFYADSDSDTYGNPAVSTTTCLGQPVGYVTNNTDCDDTTASKYRTGLFYVDADNDGYNNGAPRVSVCYGASTPSGYASINNGTDCNDASAAINPNHVEVLGNGIDDNCDGSIDEITPLSYLTASSCGVTLPSLWTTLFAYALTNDNPSQVQGYRFEVSNGATVRIFETTTNSFNLFNLAGGATYATAYNVRVAIKSGGFWRAYGSTCQVSTPAVPESTFIINPISGSTLTNISNTIFCNPVDSATGYRFKVTDGVTTRTYESAVSRFNLTNIPGGVNFGTTYSISVLLKFQGNWRPDAEYGPTSLITTPATPETSRVINPSCGSTISNSWTTIYAQQVVGAQGYKFHVTNGAQSRDFITANPRFQLPHLQGGAAANTVYTIRVDVLYNSSYVQGTQTCTIATSSSISRQTASALDIYDVKAYPNPFADNFKLDINTSSEDTVGVKVYDMLGRSIESREASVSDMTSLAIGDRYPTGVYNIVITQGDHVKTLRVIKR